MDRIQSLYDALSERFDLGSFDEFQKKIQDPAKRKALYDAASAEFELGDFDAFSLKIEDSFKKKEDGESLSQGDTSAGDFGFYSKANETAFKEYAKTSAAKYQEVIKSDPTLLSISDDINAQLVRTRDRLIDAYNFDPNFDSQDPVAVQKANEDITTRIKAKAEELYNANPEYKSIYDKYQSELEEDLKTELQERLTEEARDNADAYKNAYFKSMGAITGNPLISLFGSLSKGEGIIPIMGDAIAFQIPQAFEGWGLKNDSLNLNKMIESTEKAKSLDNNAPVYLNNKGELINPADYGGQMAKDLREGTLPESSVNGNLMTAQDALAILSDMQDSKVKEMQPKWEKATEMQEFISRINQVKPLSEDASFSNIVKTLAQQVPNMGVAMVMPVVGTAILEGGNTYLEQVQEIARQRFGEDATIEDILGVVESGEDGAAEVTGAAYVSGLLDVVGLGGIGNAVSKTVKTVGKQVLKEGAKQGLKKISSSQAYNILKAIGASGLSEGITEGLQGANMQFSRLNTVEKATDYRPDFDVKSVIEEGLIGFIMGGLMGGAGGVTTSLVNRNKTNLPETVSLEPEEGERIYFFGNDAITRKQAKNKIDKANTLKELEKVRVSNDDILAQEIETKRAKLEAAAPEVTVETGAQVAPEVLNLLTEEQRDAYNKADEATKESINEILLDESYERSIGAEEEEMPEWLTEDEKIEWEGEDKLYRSGADFSTVIDNILETTPDANEQVFVFGTAQYDIDKADAIIQNQDVELIDVPENALSKLSYDFVLKTEEGINNADITSPVILAKTEKGLLLIDGHHRVERALREGKNIKAFVLNPEQSRSIRLDLDGATPEVAPEEVVAEDKPTEQEFTMEDVSFEDDIKAIVKSGKPGSEVLNYTETYKEEGQDYYVYENPESRLNITIRKTAPRGFALDVRVKSSDEFSTPFATYETGPAFETRKGAEQFALDILRNPSLLYYGPAAVRTSSEPELAKALVESRRVKPVEETKLTKTPEMEELESEITQLQSDIETYEIEAENFQEEIEIEKGNLKEAIADIDARIKEVRESKQSAAAKRDAIEELKAEKQDIKDDNASLIEGYKEDIKNAKREAKKAANRVKRLSTKLEGLTPVQPTAEPVAEPTKKVVGTIEVEEEQAPSITEDLIALSKSLLGQVNAGVITKKEYNSRVFEALNKYTENLDEVIDANPPVDVISADDTAADIRAFEAQSPKLKFVSDLLSATKNFRGLYDAQDVPLKVYFYKSMKDMNEVGKAIDGREDIAAGFIDADSNRIFIAEDSIMEEATVHEFVHPIVKRIIYNNPELASRIEAEALAIPGIKEFVEQYETKDQQEEAIVQSIALAVLDNLKKGRTIPQKIKDFFMKLLRLVGFNPEVVIGDSESNLNNFIKNISESFATGRPIKITEDLQKESVLFDLGIKEGEVVKVKVADSAVGKPINKIKLSDRKELSGLRFVDPKQFNNKKVQVTQYDNLTTGDVKWKNRVTGKTFVFKGKKGGPMHPYLKEMKRNNVVAAYTELKTALNYAKNANDSEFLLFALMSPEESMHANRAIAQDFFKTALEDISGVFGFDSFKRDMETILTTKGVQDFKSKLYSFKSPTELAEYIDRMSYAERRSVFENVFPTLTGTPTKSTIMQDKYGLPTSGEIYVMYREESMNNATTSDIYGAAKIKNVILVNEEEYSQMTKQQINRIFERYGVVIKQIAKEAEHPSYPFSIEGETVGLFNSLINARDILPYAPSKATNVIKNIEGQGPKVSVTKINEAAELREFTKAGLSEAVVTAAPIRIFPEFFARKYKGKQPTVKDIIAIKNSSMFKSYRTKFIDSAKLFNITVGNITTNIGVWEGALEYSNNLEVKGAPTDLKAFAAYMGLVAEPQKATIVSSVREGAKNAAITIEYKNEKLAQKAVDDITNEGIIGLSYDTDRKIITIFAQDGDKERFQSYYERNQSSIKNVEFYEADVDFISEEDYQGILREYRSSEQNQGARRQDLRNAITEVLGESPINPFGRGLSRIKHTKATRQNIIRPSQIIQQEFEKRHTPKRIGSKYYQDLEILRNVDLEELGLLTDNSGTNIGLDLVKEYNKIMPDLVASTMPVPKQLEPALALANKIKDALDYTTHDKVVQYSSILLAHLANDPSGLTSEKEVLDAFREAYVEFDIEEFTEADEEFIKANIDEIRQYASDVYLSGLENKKFSERMSGTIYEGREALIKNDITRSASAILARQREELIKQGYKNIDVEQLELGDSDMDAIAEKLGGGDEFAKILKSNRKSINNTARNDLRNQNRVDGLIETSKRNFKRGVIQKYMNRTTFNNDKVLDKVSFLVKPEWTQDEITVLKDYMEHHEVKKLFQAVQSLQHGYLPPMSYGIIRKLQQATNAIKLAEGVGNITIMTDANGRIIRDRIAVREARELTELTEKLAKLDPEELQKRTTSGAMPYFQQVKDKTIARFYNEISKAFSIIESQREIDIANYNEKYSKIKQIIEFEGEEYTNADVNILAHQYLIEKQYLSNPGSERVPKLYDSLIKSITNLTNAENKRYIELFEKFKLENNTLDIQKVQSFLKRAGALNEATQESGMAFVNYVEKRMKDSRVRVRHLQEFQNKTKVETFENYIYVATKAKANTGEAKVDLIESLLNTSNINTLGFAKTSVTRQSYRKSDGTHKLLSAREPVFDLMFAANFATNEVLNAYHLGETFRDIQAQLNILAKMGDINTQVLAQALKNDVRARIINYFGYKMSAPSSKGDTILSQLLSGTYTAYLASGKRFVELISNAFLVGIADPSIARALVVNAKDNIGNATISETRAIMNKIGSAHTERFNGREKAFYTAEGVGAERIKGQTPSIFDNYKKKDGRFRTSYKGYLAALNKLGEMQTGIKNFADKIVRMSDVKIASVAWNTVFKDKFQELTGVEYSSEMINDETLFIQYRASMMKAVSYADVFVKMNFAGNAFDMNQRAIRNPQTIKYIQNMFRTFRTFYYESNRDAVLSLSGYSDGTMSKEEAIRRLAGASAASVIYAIGTTALMNVFFEQLFSTLGLGEDEEEDKEFEIAAKNAVVEFILMSSVGRLPAIQYGLISGSARATIRYAEQEDISHLEALNKHVQRFYGSDYLLRQTVPIIRDPSALTRETITTAIDAFQGDIKEGDAKDLFIQFLRTAAIYKGIPFSGDIMSAYYTYQKMQDEEVKASTKKTKYKPKYKSILE